MRRQVTWPRSLILAVLAAACLAGSGCLTFLHPVETAPAEVHATCLAYPPCCRDHVYVFLVHGMDPFDWANLAGLHDYVQTLGFRKTYYGQLYHTWKFEKEIRRSPCGGPRARFVLIGFSFGANVVRYLANSVRDDHIPDRPAGLLRRQHAEQRGIRPAGQRGPDRQRPGERGIWNGRLDGSGREHPRDGRVPLRLAVAPIHAARRWRASWRWWPGTSRSWTTARRRLRRPRGSGTSSSRWPISRRHDNPVSGSPLSSARLVPYLQRSTLQAR